MFLIEFSEGQFVDAKKISWLSTTGTNVKFTVQGKDAFFEVSDPYTSIFLNHINALNENITMVA